MATAVTIALNVARSCWWVLPLVAAVRLGPNVGRWMVGKVSR